MSLVRILPTDRHGNVYYGPKTTEQAKQAVAEIVSEFEHPEIKTTSLPEAVAEVSGDLIRAGYTGVAARLRAYFA